MGKISDFERKFRRKEKATFKVVGITLDYDEIMAGGWDIDAIMNTFEAHWEGDYWNCYYISADEDLSDTTVNKVKRNISQFFKADPAVKSYKKITVK